MGENEKGKSENTFHGLRQYNLIHEGEKITKLKSEVMRRQALTTSHQQTSAQPLLNFIAEHDVIGHGIPLVSAGMSSCAPSQPLAHSQPTC